MTYKDYLRIIPNDNGRWLIPIFMLFPNQYREIEEYLDEEDTILKNTEQPDIRNDILEFSREIDSVLRKDLRKQYLESQLEILEVKSAKCDSDFKDSRDRGISWSLRQATFEINGCSMLESKKKQIENRLFFLSLSPKEKKSNWIFKLDAARKRNPKDYIKSNQQGFALCLWHSDSTPSLKLYENHVHCFSCGAHKDTIALVMKQSDISFRDAVNRISFI